ncbi:MAG TPA: DUF6443 domain-containing protein, partial [Dongiaceae bacterium]|nr:DUF6443 domain-containing protein [Dongiaceae bacterium]
MSQCVFANYTLTPSGNICGSTATITLSGSQSGVSYQLLGGTNDGDIGSPIAGTGTAISWPNVSIVAGGGYVVEAAKSGCSGTVVAETYLNALVPLASTDVTVTVSNNGAMCSGGSVTLTATVANAPNRTGITYQWFYYHGGPIAGATSSTFTTSTAETYNVLVSCNCGSQMIQCPSITAESLPTAPGPVSGIDTISNGALTQSVYTITPSANATGYAWSLSNMAAGSIAPNGTSAIVTWNAGFIGIVTVNAAATTACGNTPAAGLAVTLQPRTLVSDNQNYILSTSVLSAGATTDADITNLSSAAIRQQITYFDGLGRPMQDIAIQAAPDGKDIVTPITYDGYGRQDKSYLPYAAGDTTGSYRSAINPTYTNSAQYLFYQQTADTSIPVIPNPYSQTVFEASPLNRPLQLANPGSTWAVGSGHTVNTDYEINVASEVRLWNITTDANGNNTGATGSGYYAAGE